MTRQQFKKLPLKRKFSYLLEKYLAASVLAVFLISAISTLIYEDYFKQQPLLSVDMINVNQESTDASAFNSFLEGAGYEVTDKSVKLDKRYQFRGSEADLGLMPEQVMICNVSVGKTDIYFWDTPDMEARLAGSILVDLRTVMPEEFLLEHADKLIYTGPLLEGGYPCGISLEDCEWVEDNNYYSRCAVGISRKTKDPGLTSEFLEYIT